jgi:hypothetical protein
MLRMFLSGKAVILLPLILLEHCCTGTRTGCMLLYELENILLILFQLIPVITVSSVSSIFDPAS